MKKSILPYCLAFSLMTAAGARAESIPIKSAEVTEVHNDVRLQAQKIQKPAAVGDTVEGGKILETGKKSRAEIMFNDKSVARLGANSIFSFKSGGRDLRLTAGFLLLNTPQGNGGAKISTPTASAAVLGCTVMLSSMPSGVVKLLVLEGTATLSFGGQTVTVHAGQFVIFTPGQGISGPFDFDLAKLIATSNLLNSFNGDLGSENLIDDAVDEQKKKIEEEGLKIVGDDEGLKILHDPALNSVIDAQTERPEPPPVHHGGEGGSSSSSSGF